MSRFHSSQIAILVVLLITVWIYAPALGFGFIWDDPIWLGRLIDKPLGTLIAATPDYQFYRPGTLIYHRLFLSSNGTFAAPPMHAAQIGFHLLNVALIYALIRRFGFGEWTAWATGTLVALYPFSHQAVAWAAAHQPLATTLQNAALLTYMSARRRGSRSPYVGLSLLLFLAALITHESAVVLAPVPLLIEWLLRRSGSDKCLWSLQSAPKLALAYPLAATVFAMFWLQLPRQTGYTTLAFDGRVALYLVQGFIFPAIGRLAGYAPTLAPGTLLMIAGLTLGGVFAVVWRTGRTRQALFGMAWAILGVLPSAVGLRYSYVSLGARLLYHSSPGIALLWVTALLPTVSKQRELDWWKHARIAILGLTIAQSSLLLLQFQGLYAAGTDHLSSLIHITETENPRILVVNFPDRYAPKRPPYPLGYWGVTLAPISVDLGEFSAIITGQEPNIISRRIPQIDHDARQAGPYDIDMRGLTTQPEQLYQLAHQVDAVYLSRHFPDGTFAMQRAGSVTPGSSTKPALSCQLANFQQTACLQEVEIDPQPGYLKLSLTWHSLAPAQAHDTIFAHVGTADQPPIAQSDDDACLGLLPMSTWLPGDVIREQRIISLPDPVEPGQYEIRIGVYNRASGARLTAALPDGQPLQDDVIVVGHFP
jgi:hypothetical protein